MFQASLKRIPQLPHMIQTAIPLKRAATPKEIANAIVFLSSPLASYINGTTLIVDAGTALSANAS